MGDSITHVTHTLKTLKTQTCSSWQALAPDCSQEPRTESPKEES